MSATDAESRPGPGATSGPPVTGVAEIDSALARLTGLDDRPLSEHHDRLSQAQRALQDALDRDPTVDRGEAPDEQGPARP